MWNPFNRKSKSQDEVEAEESVAVPASQTLLEDLPPKFEDNVEAAIQARRAKRPSISEAASTITVNDFQNLHKIPCFREGVVTGGVVSGVVAAVMLIARRPLKQSINWGVVGFAMSSTAAWEQCRYKKRKSQRNAEMAKIANKEVLEKERGSSK